MTEAERAEWNAAVAAGDTARVDALRDLYLRRIHERIMNDDPDYTVAGWEPSR